MEMHGRHRARVRALGLRGMGATENGVVTGWRLTVKAQNIALEAPTEVREETKGHWPIERFTERAERVLNHPLSGDLWQERKIRR